MPDDRPVKILVNSYPTRDQFYEAMIETAEREQVDVEAMIQGIVVRVDHQNPPTVKELDKLQSDKYEALSENRFNNILTEKQEEAMRAAKEEWALEVLQRFDALDMSNYEAILDWLVGFRRVADVAVVKERMSDIDARFEKAGYNVIDENEVVRSYKKLNDMSAEDRLKHIVGAVLGAAQGDPRLTSYLDREFKGTVERWKYFHGEQSRFVHAEEEQERMRRGERGGSILK